MKQSVAILWVIAEPGSYECGLIKQLSCGGDSPPYMAKIAGNIVAVSLSRHRTSLDDRNRIQELDTCYPG